MGRNYLPAVNKPITSTSVRELSDGRMTMFAGNVRNALLDIIV